MFDTTKITLMIRGTNKVALTKLMEMLRCDAATIIGDESGRRLDDVVLEIGGFDAIVLTYADHRRELNLPPRGGGWQIIVAGPDARALFPRGSEVGQRDAKNAIGAAPTLTQAVELAASLFHAAADAL